MLTKTKRRVLFYLAILVFLLLLFPVILYSFGYGIGSDFKLHKTGGVFIKVSEASLGAAQPIEIKGTDSAALIETLPRTVFDGISDYARFGTLPQAYGWIAERRVDKTFLKGLVDITIQYGNVSTRRRLGCWLELLKADRKLVDRLLRSVKPTQSFIPLAPGRKGGGTTNSRWGVLVNYEVSDVEAG